MNIQIYRLGSLKALLLGSLGLHLQDKTLTPPNRLETLKPQASYFMSVRDSF